MYIHSGLNWFIFFFFMSHIFLLFILTIFLLVTRYCGFYNIWMLVIFTFLQIYSVFWGKVILPGKSVISSHPFKIWLVGSERYLAKPGIFYFNTTDTLSQMKLCHGDSGDGAGGCSMQRRWFSTLSLYLLDVYREIPPQFWQPRNMEKLPNMVWMKTSLWMSITVLQLISSTTVVILF